MTFLEKLKALVSKPGLKDPAGKAGSLWFIMTRDNRSRYGRSS